MRTEYRILKNEFGEFGVALVQLDFNDKPVTAARLPTSHWFKSLDDLELTLRRKLEATYKATIDIGVFE